jgi:uridine kinase
VTETRAAVLAAVAARIDVLPRPAVVAIDGVSAAGKTTFADELAQRARPPAIRISVDDFHRPASERYAHGQGPDTYYNDTFDLPALRRALDGVDAGAAAVVDGIFLLRPELADIWAFSVFLDVDRAVALERAIARDAALFGGEDAARRRYAARYTPGETLYLEQAGPSARADIVIENTDPDRPRLLRAVVRVSDT